MAAPRRRSLLAGLAVIAAGLGVIGAIVSWVVQDASPSRARSGSSGDGDGDGVDEPGESLVPIPDPSAGEGAAWYEYAPGYALAEELGEAAGRAWESLWSD